MWSRCESWKTERELVMQILDHIGSLASILGLCVSLYVLYREIAISKDVTTLKNEEESWHRKV
jgi:hypothetical protein